MELVTSKSMPVGALILLAACNGRVADTPTTSAPGDTAPPVATRPALPPDTVDPGGTGPSYPGTGFRVHEWGTNTIVVGSDGVMLRGLQHEEEDLPGFVYDRTREEVAQSPVEVKMETPVAYFYSDKPLTANVQVRFPKGVLTQWYPSVREYFPPVLIGLGDPALDKKFPYSKPECRQEFSTVHDGMLDWGPVEILGRGAPLGVESASLDRFTWSHARAVDANGIRVPAREKSPAQNERFLFYRGLGNFPMPVRITSRAGLAGGLSLQNDDAGNKLGAVFVLRVEGDKADFAVHPAGVAPNQRLEATAPPATRPLDAYAQDLAKAMVTELDKAGLYHDESIGMVKTWARQWFRTPGVRVLYLAPEAWTNRQIPLDVTPKPEEMVRVMVIRVEALSPAEEDRDLAAARDLGVGPGGEAHFVSLGRFAEPRLRRAIARMAIPTAGALSYLDRISGADISVRAGE